jgi:hypothetical protein
MTARQLSERVPDADRGFGPSADACSQKFEGPRSRPELPRSPAFVRIVSICVDSGYRASLNNFCTLGPPQGVRGAGALTANPNKPEMPS